MAWRRVSSELGLLPGADYCSPLRMTHFCGCVPHRASTGGASANRSHDLTKWPSCCANLCTQVYWNAYLAAMEGVGFNGSTPLYVASGLLTYMNESGAWSFGGTNLLFAAFMLKSTMTCRMHAIPVLPKRTWRVDRVRAVKLLLTAASTADRPAKVARQRHSHGRDPSRVTLFIPATEQVPRAMSGTPAVLVSQNGRQRFRRSWTVGCAAAW